MENGKSARAVNKWRTDRKEKARAMLAAFISKISPTTTYNSLLTGTGNKKSNGLSFTESKTGRDVDPSTITNTCPVGGEWKIVVKDANGVEYPKVRTSTIKQSEFVLLEKALKSGKVTARWAGDGDDDLSDDIFERSDSDEFTTTNATSKDSLLISISPDQIPQVMKMDEENKALKRKLKLAEERLAQLEEENQRLKRLKLN